MSDIRRTIQKLDEMTAGATGSGSIAGNGLGFASGGIGEKPQKRVKEDSSIKVDKASNFGDWANTPQKTAKQHKVKDMKVVEAKKDDGEADYDDKYQAMVKRVGAKAKQQDAKKQAKKPVKESVDIAEASTVDGVVQDPKTPRWKQTSIGYEEAVKKYGKDCVKQDGKSPSGRPVVYVKVPLGEQHVNEAELSEEQLLARELKKRFDLFKQGKDHELGSKPKDREIQAKESADGVSPATKMVLEVDPRNYDSDEDYYAALNAPAKPKMRGYTIPRDSEDDAYSGSRAERAYKADQERVKAGWAAHKAKQDGKK